MFLRVLSAIRHYPIRNTDYATKTALRFGRCTSPYHATRRRPLPGLRDRFRSLYLHPPAAREPPPGRSPDARLVSDDKPRPSCRPARLGRVPGAAPAPRARALRAVLQHPLWPQWSPLAEPLLRLRVGRRSRLAHTLLRRQEPG